MVTPLAPPKGAADGPSYRSSPNAAQARAAAQMRNSPEELTAAADQMSAHVVQPRTLSNARSLVVTPACVAGQDRGAHVDMIQQRGFTALEPRSIETLESLRPLRQTRSCPEQQEKAEDDGDVDHHRAEGVPPNGRPLVFGQRGGLVVSMPGSLVSKAKAAPQDVVASLRLGGHSMRRGRLPGRRLRLLAFESIEIEVGLDAARENVARRDRPKRSQHAPRVRPARRATTRHGGPLVRSAPWTAEIHSAPALVPRVRYTTRSRPPRRAPARGPHTPACARPSNRPAPCIAE